MDDQQPVELDSQWEKLLDYLEASVGKRPADLNGVLFLIGIQELGQGVRHFTKEQKQDLMHIAVCKVLSLSGYYELVEVDLDGWPHWKLIKKLPAQDLTAQEKLIREHVLKYFENLF